MLGKEELWHEEGFQVCSRTAAGNLAVNARVLPENGPCRSAKVKEGSLNRNIELFGRIK